METPYMLMAILGLSRIVVGTRAIDTNVDGQRIIRLYESSS
jgi:hypothetical protein